LIDTNTDFCGPIEVKTALAAVLLTTTALAPALQAWELEFYKMDLQTGVEFFDDGSIGSMRGMSGSKMIWPDTGVESVDNFAASKDKTLVLKYVDYSILSAIW